MTRFFMQWQDFEIGFSNVSAIYINQARNQNFFGKIFVESHVFFISITFISIYRLRFGDFLGIC